MIRFAALAAFVELAALAAFPLVPLAVLFADQLGRLPRWARWMETQDRPGWLGPPSEGYPASKWGLVRWLWRNRAYTLRNRYRATPDYRDIGIVVSGSIAHPRLGLGRLSIDIHSRGRTWWYRRWSLGLRWFVVYVHAGWKLVGYVEGARPEPDALVSTGMFIGVAIRTDSLGDRDHGG
jgi:hypothetical protein